MTNSLAGHIDHLYDDPTLKFSELKDILTKLSLGQIEASEKLDGISIFLSYSIKENKIKAARSQSDIKLNGLDLNKLSIKFADKGDLLQAFTEAFNSFELFCRSLGQDNVVNIFGQDANNYYSFEIQGPKTENIIHYDNDFLILHQHGHLSYEPNIGEITPNIGNGYGILYHCIDYNPNQFGLYKIIVNPTIQLRPLQNQNNVINILSEIQKLQDFNALKDTATVGDFILARLENFIKKNISNLMPATRKALIEKIAGFKGLNILKILEKIPPEQQIKAKQIIDNSNLIQKDAIQPLELLIHNFANEVLRNFKSKFLTNPQNEIFRIKKLTQDAIDTIRMSNHDKAIQFVSTQIKKLGNIENINCASEGIVFVYNDKLFKLTGSFAPINQIVGILKFGRGKEIPPLGKFIKESSKNRIIAVFPGAFKPPHAGHFLAAKELEDIPNINEIKIIISQNERTDQERHISINTDQSLAIWEIFCKHLTKTKPIISTKPSPVQFVYDFLLSVNPGDSVILVKGEKDKEDDTRFRKAKEWAEKNNLKINIDYHYTKDIVSGTDLRELIVQGNKNDFLRYIPKQLSLEEKETIWNIVSNSKMPLNENNQKKSLDKNNKDFFDAIEHFNEISETNYSPNDFILIKNELMSVKEICKYDDVFGWLETEPNSIIVPKINNKKEWDFFQKEIESQTSSRDYTHTINQLKKGQLKPIIILISPENITIADGRGRVNLAYAANIKIPVQIFKTKTLNEHIVKTGDNYCLKSKKNNKNLGCYPSKEGAERREKQVQYFKHLNEESSMGSGAVEGSAQLFPNLKNNDEEKEYFFEIKNSLNEVFDDQTYGDNEGNEYKIIDLFNFAKENKKIVDISIDDLIHNINPEDSNNFDEPLGSEEFTKRANDSNLNYPIIVINDNGQLNIADGNHRLYKAEKLNHKTIKAYVLEKDEIEPFKITSDELGTTQNMEENINENEQYYDGQWKQWFDRKTLMPIGGNPNNYKYIPVYDGVWIWKGNEWIWKGEHDVSGQPGAGFGDSEQSMGKSKFQRYEPLTEHQSDRLVLAEELKLREHIQSLIRECLTQDLNEMNLLRKTIRNAILQESKSNIPDAVHASTGINVLEDLLKKIIPSLEEDYKTLTTSPEQRESFRAHILNAINNSLTTADMNAHAAVASPEGSNFQSNLKESLYENDPASLGQPAQQLQDQVSVGIGGGEPTPDDQDKFIDIEKKPGQDEAEEDTFTIAGKDLTGRNVAQTAYDKIEKNILDSYSVLSDPQDQQLFYSYLMSNLKLYLNKFEEEMSASVQEPQAGNDVMQNSTQKGV